jgi:hypothetical protein
MSFDLSNVKAQGNDTLPAGKYVCNITNAELKDTKAGNGQYIKIEFTVKEGDSSGRKLWAQINVKNSNPKAAEIGLSQLKALLVCSSYPTPDKLSGIGELNGLTVGVKTKVKTDEYGEKAEVSYFYEPKKDLAPAADLPF